MKRILGALLTLLAAQTSAIAAETPGACPQGIESDFLQKRDVVLESLDEWVAAGSLDLSAEEQDRLRRIAPEVKVSCSDRVYLDPLKPETEVSFVNEPQTRPPRKYLPRVTIGTARRKEFRDRLGEMAEADASLLTSLAGWGRPEPTVMVLHELLGTARIRDHRFEKTKPLMKALREEWKTYRREMLAKTTRIEQNVLSIFDSSHLAAAENALEVLSQDPDWDACAHLTGSSKKERKMIGTTCAPLFKKIETLGRDIVAPAVGPDNKAAGTEITKLWNELKELLEVQRQHHRRVQARTGHFHFRTWWFTEGERYLEKLSRMINRTNETYREGFNEGFSRYSSPASIFTGLNFEELTRAYCPQSLKYGARSLCLRDFLMKEALPVLRASIDKVRAEWMADSRDLQINDLPDWTETL